MIENISGKTANKFRLRSGIVRFGWLWIMPASTLQGSRLTPNPPTTPRLSLSLETVSFRAGVRRRICFA